MKLHPPARETKPASALAPGASRPIHKNTFRPMAPKTYPGGTGTAPLGKQMISNF